MHVSINGIPLAMNETTTKEVADVTTQTLSCMDSVRDVSINTFMSESKFNDVIHSCTDEGIVRNVFETVANADRAMIHTMTETVAYFANLF